MMTCYPAWGKQVEMNPSILDFKQEKKLIGLINMSELGCPRLVCISTASDSYSLCVISLMWGSQIHSPRWLLEFQASQMMTPETGWTRSWKAESTLSILGMVSRKFYKHSYFVAFLLWFEISFLVSELQWVVGIKVLMCPVKKLGPTRKESRKKAVINASSMTLVPESSASDGGGKKDSVRINWENIMSKALASHLTNLSLISGISEGPARTLNIVRSWPWAQLVWSKKKVLK